MKTRHDGDCTIYAVLENIDMPEAGICTCGYAHQYRRENDGDDKELYSEQLLKKLESRTKVDKDVFVTNEGGRRGKGMLKKRTVLRPYCFGNYSDCACNECPVVEGCIKQLTINNAEHKKREGIAEGIG